MIFNIIVLVFLLFFVFIIHIVNNYYMKKDDPMYKFVEHRLASLYEEHRIKKIYKHIITFLITICMISGIYVNYYVINKEDTKAIKDSTKIIIEQMQEDSFLSPFNNRINYNKLSYNSINKIMTAYSIMNLADNTLKLSVSLNTIENKDFNKEDIINTLNNNNQLIDNLYFKIYIPDKTKNPTLLFLSKIKNVNMKIKEINNELITMISENKIDLTNIKSKILSIKDKDIDTYQEILIDIKREETRYSFYLFLTYFLIFISLYDLLGIIRYNYLKRKYFQYY